MPNPKRTIAPEQHYWSQVVVGDAGLARFIAQVQAAWASGEQLAADRVVFCREHPLKKPEQGETGEVKQGQMGLPLEGAAGD